MIFLLGILLFSITMHAQQPLYLFKSGFEGTTLLHQCNLEDVYNTAYAEITGTDNGSDWNINLDQDSTFGSFRNYYENGDTSKSKAEIVTDPTNAANKALKFSINNPHIEYQNNNGDSLRKGRIQAFLANNHALHKIINSPKVYLHPDFSSNYSIFPNPINDFLSYRTDLDDTSNTSLESYIH